MDGCYTTLLLTNKDIDRCTGEGPVLPDLVLQKALIGILDPLRQVAEKDERGYATRRKLGNILDLDILSFTCGRGIVLNDRQHHLVQLGSRDTLGTILINHLRRLQHLQDTLFRQR